MEKDIKEGHQKRPAVAKALARRRKKTEFDKILEKARKSGELKA